MLHRRAAFSLIELVVVIAIVAVLVAAISPGLSKSRTTSRAVACQGNLKQIHTTVAAHAAGGGEVRRWNQYAPLDSLEYLGLKRASLICPERRLGVSGDPMRANTSSYRGTAAFLRYKDYNLSKGAAVLDPADLLPAVEEEVILHPAGRLGITVGGKLTVEPEGD